MELATQIISNNQTLASNAIQDSKEFNSQSLATQVKKGEQLVSMISAFEKTFDLMGDDLFELSKENDALKNKIGFYDEKRLEKYISKLLQQSDDDEKANLVMSRMQKQMKTL